MSDRLDIEPLTAREALLLILHVLDNQVASGGLRPRVRSVAEQGLKRDEPPNFELTDELADRLAEAHKVLRGLVDGHDQARPGRSFLTDQFANELRGVLMLPSSLKAMVDRRIGPQ